MNIFSKSSSLRRYFSIGRAVRAIAFGGWMACKKEAEAYKGKEIRDTLPYVAPLPLPQPRAIRSLSRNHIKVRPPATSRSGGIRGSMATKWKQEKRKKGLWK